MVWNFVRTNFLVIENLLNRFVSQACHLLNVLSKELLSDFEACAEIFIPVILEAISVLCKTCLIVIGLTY